MRKATAVLSSIAAVAALAATASPAQAVDGSTTVALTVADGTLAIVTTPAAPAATSAIVGTGRVVTAPLGVTTIADTRVLSSGWTFSAATTAFTLTGGTDTIPASAAAFSVPTVPVATLGTPTYTHKATPGTGSGLATASGSGISTTTLTPVLTVTVPASAATGVYTGTVTQSVV